MDPYIGEIRILPFTFAPAGWLECNGQTLPIAQYQALFVIIGTTYGGNGTTNFNLPNLGGAVPVGVGQGNGLSVYSLGETTGSNSITLTAAQTPMHNHTLSGAGAQSGETASPSGAYLSDMADGSGSVYPSYSTSSSAQLNPQSVGLTGGQAHENRQPYTAFRFCIAYTGIFPSRG
jgi:microcystin-dependent protein